MLRTLGCEEHDRGDNQENPSPNLELSGKNHITPNTELFEGLWRKKTLEKLNWGKSFETPLQDQKLAAQLIGYKVICSMRDKCKTVIYKKEKTINNLVNSCEKPCNQNCN